MNTDPEIAELATLRLTPDSIRAISRLAERLPASYAAGESPATQWFNALLLERAGDLEGAGAAFEAIPDEDFGEVRALRLMAVARTRPADSSALAQAARAAQKPRTLAALDKLCRKVPLKRTVRIALTGSTTLEFWAPALRACCFSWGFSAELYLAPFGQYTQELLDPQSSLSSFQPEIVVLAVDWRALSLPAESSDPAGFIARQVASFEALWARAGATVIQMNFEVPEADPLGGRFTGSRSHTIANLNLALAEAAGRHPSTGILDLNQIASLYGKTAWHDEALYHAAKQYPAHEATPLLMRHLAALIRASLGLTSKCLVLDLDGTLWGGVIGEDGLGGIRLGGSPEGEAYLDFHRYVQALGQRGIILAVCSKNNEDDALLPFRQHPECILKREDFACFTANWSPKHENLRQIAATLNIGLDSLVFLDDNPLERNLVRRLLPEVEVPELPLDPANYVQALHRSLCFEAWTLTRDDRLRAQAYRDNAQREEHRAASGSVDEYLASLQMQLELRAFDRENLPRIVQLINKTNQFNLTTRRMTEAECQELMDNPEAFTLSMRLRDKFGDNGLTGVLMALGQGETLHLDNWLMSCRVLGRRVEDCMLVKVFAHARRAGYRRITASFIPTAKNAQVRDLYERFGFRVTGELPDGARHFESDVEPMPFTPPAWMRLDL